MSIVPFVAYPGLFVSFVAYPFVLSVSFVAYLLVSFVAYPLASQTWGHRCSDRNVVAVTC